MYVRILRLPQPVVKDYACPFPLATGLGSDVQRPLATVIVWGLLSATRLTLLVLPVLDEIVRQAVPLRNTRRSGIQIVEIGGNRSPNLVE